MPADKHRVYSPDKVYDVPAQIQRADRNGETRARNHERNGNQAAADRARADAVLTIGEWKTGSHPALRASRHHNGSAA